jgi:hypothetical protein
MAPAAGTYGAASLLLGWAMLTAIILRWALLLLIFLCLSIGAYTTGAGDDGSVWNHIGGWPGALTALNAFYLAAAGILKDVSGGRDIMPVFPSPIRNKQLTNTSAYSGHASPISPLYTQRREGPFALLCVWWDNS